ncbi:MAG TPA: hypothetical protein VFV38_37465 [Ktedonobacteraceae bacterium]|nr:hypothetical protein [Ktedonobacteraceae bacterium]
MKQRWIARWIAEGKHQQLTFDSVELLSVAKVDFRLLCLAQGITVPEEYHLLEGTPRPFRLQKITIRGLEHAE